MSVLIIKGGKIQFGDLQRMDTIYYIDPIIQKIQPAFVIGNLAEDKVKDLARMEVILIPEEYRDRPIAELPVSVVKKIVFSVKKTHTMVLVSSNPPTIYSTTLKELEEWVQNKGGLLINGNTLIKPNT